MWQPFAAFCAATRVPALPASGETLIAYVETMIESVSYGAMQRHVWAINRVHRMANHKRPGMSRVGREYLRAVRRQMPASSRSARACRRPELEQLLEALPKGTLAAVRDRMIMLLLYFGALGTFELLDLDIDKLEFADNVLILNGIGRRCESRVIGRGRGSMCPVRAVENWLAQSGLVSGPLIRGIGGGKMGGRGRYGVADISVQRYPQGALWVMIRTWCRNAGVPLRGMTALSFRYGFLLDAYDARIRLSELADHFGYLQVRTVIANLRRLRHPLRADDETPRRRVRNVAWRTGYRPQGP